MPFKSDKAIISGTVFDKRVKVLPEDKENIRHLFFVDKKGIREISRLYEKQCSRRTIQFILYPERLKRVVELHDWTKYYTKESNNKYQTKHRNYKHNLVNNGLITL